MHFQNEINKVMLARGSREYALKVVDPAFTPELPSSPKLSLWLLLDLFDGFFSALSWRSCEAHGAAATQNDDQRQSLAD
jgi:hypothetical protein